ncbi:DUF4239 domain-containing protein [Mitsuaria sp. CC2]|uniref:bestrophin-like domain n=1 Tax=Mitsuaria sp. CC2 TaxID=3029186 RepID=UPI003B8BC727
MPLIVYDLPNWVLGLALVLGWVVLGLGAQAVFPRRWRERATESDRNVALASLGVIATINSLLLAFSAVSVWDSFGAAEQAVSREATAIAQLARTLAVYGSPETRLARERLRGYGRSVIGKEWPAMQREQPNQPTLDAFDDVYRTLGELRPASAAETVLVQQMWSEANDLLTQRRARLAASDGKVPTTLWVVVLVSSLLTLAPVAVLPVTACSRSAIVVLALALGLVFHFVAAMDRPFLGAERVTSEPIESALDNMQRWDARSVAGVGR